MCIYELPDKEFTIIVTKTLNELKGNTDTQLNKIRKTMHEQNGNINKERNYKKQIMELKNIITEPKKKNH